jgi:hypothetical protein
LICRADCNLLQPERGVKPCGVEETMRFERAEVRTFGDEWNHLAMAHLPIGEDDCVS